MRRPGGSGLVFTRTLQEQLGASPTRVPYIVTHLLIHQGSCIGFG